MRSGASFLVIGSICLHVILAAQSLGSSNQESSLSTLNDLELHNRLDADYKNLDLWREELRRSVAEDAKLSDASRVVPLTPASKDLLAIDRIRQGSAQIHLGDPRGALKSLSAANSVITDIEQSQSCASDPHSAICTRVSKLFPLMYCYFALASFNVKEDVQGSAYLQRAIGFIDTTEDYKSMVGTCISYLLERQEYSRSVDVVIGQLNAALSEPRSPRLEAAGELAESLFLRLYYNISWDPKSGKRRTNDPRGFADNSGLGIDRPFKYGMTDPEEDLSTLVTVIDVAPMYRGKRLHIDPKQVDETGYGSAERLQENYAVANYVRKLMRQGVFELAAKYLYATQVMTGFDIKEGSLRSCAKARGAEISIKEIEGEISRNPVSEKQVNTVAMIRLFEAGIHWRQQHCPAR